MAMAVMMVMMTLTAVGVASDSNIKVLADYTTQAAIEASGLTAQSDITLNGDIAGKFTKQGWNSTAFTVAADTDPNFPTDWTEYTYIKIMMYSSKIQADTKFNVVAYSANGNNYFISYVPFDWIGWKEIVIPISTMNKSGEAVWTDIDNLQLVFTGWDNADFPGSHWNVDGIDMRFDNVCLSTATSEGTEILVGGAANEANIKVLANYTTQTAIDVSGLTAQSNITLNGDIAGKFTKQGWNSTAFTVAADTDSNFPTDWTGYTHLNIMMYSDAVYADTKFNVVAYSANGNNYFISFIPFDWTGWKKISIPLSVMGKSGEAVWTDIDNLQLVFTGWDDANFPGSHWNVDNIGMYFDHVYLSTESNASTEYEVLRGEYASSKTQQQLGTGYDYTNKNLYNSTFKWNTAWTWDPAIFKFPATDLSKYTYMNMWVKSNTSANSKSLIRFLEADGLSGRLHYITPEYSTGWTMISVPISDMKDSYTKNFNNISQMALNSRGWDCVIDTNVNYYIDRIWLSEALPSGMARLVEYPEQDGNTISVNDRIFRFELDERVSVASNPAEIMLTKADGTVVNGVSAYAEDTTLCVVADSLDYGTEYELSIGEVKLAQGYSAEIDDYITFTTEDESFTVTTPVLSEASGDVTATSTVTNKTNGPKDATIIVATYEGERLSSVQPESYTIVKGDSIDISATAPKTGTTVKAFVFESLTNLKPYEFSDQ